MNDDRILIIGLQGSGKTEYAKMLIKEHLKRDKKRVLIFDIMEEYKSAGRVDLFRIKNKSNPTPEAELCIKAMINGPKEKTGKCGYSLLVIDETGQYYPNRSTLPPEFSLINHTMRHIPIRLICISRRISQIHTDLSELATQLIIFKQAGVNDIKRLNDISAGLGDAAAKLGEHRYITVNADRTFTEHDPIKIKD